jgi:hypothetical protein
MGTDTPLAVYNNQLYVSFETGSFGEVVYSAFDGSSWSAPVAIAGPSAAGPALAAKGKKLYASWINDTNGDVMTASFKGAKWTTPAAIPGASITLETGPAIAAYDGSLFAAWDPTSPPSGIEYSKGP